MKYGARIISGTIRGILESENGKHIKVSHYVVGTLNMRMGFVISILDKKDKILYMLSNPGETNQPVEKVDIDAMEGVRLEGVISNGGWRRFKGVILPGQGGIYIEVSGYKKRVFHNPGPTRVIKISETLKKYYEEYKKG